MSMISSAVKIHIVRLKPHDDLKRSIMAFAQKNNITAGIILTCVGSLEQYHLRFANQKNGKARKDFFEILSLTGTFSNTSCHLHLSIADSSGRATGGHLLEENFIYTTAEIALAELSDLTFERSIDPTYGYQELS